MSRPDLPVVRKALREGMYILLDENLGGGVSIQKNLAALPEKFRRNALKGREDVEREILLGPVLAAAPKSVDALRREALVRSFDGSFFKGRTYARQPTGMIDVGNDREFGFLVEPDLAVLDRTFAALLNSDSTPDVRRRAIQLASFFRVPDRSTDASIQAALLRGLTDPDPSVRDAARTAIANDLALRGAETDPDRVASIRGLLRGSDARAIVKAISRNRALVGNPEILRELRQLLSGDEAIILLPLLGHPTFTDSEVLTAVQRSWPKAGDPLDRLGLLDAVLARSALFDREEPSKEVVDLCSDWPSLTPSSTVRERTLNAIGSLDRLGSSRLANSLLMSSLADDTPALRRMGLALATPRASFWARPDARERLLSLLVDPDAKVRDQALACVEGGNKLIEGVPAFARRVKALDRDPALKARAEAALRAGGVDPRAIEADVKLGRPRLLSLSTFRSKVNPLFYQAGEDGYSCARCHATHNVLRIGEIDPAKGFDGEALMINYTSVLKVVKLGKRARGQPIAPQAEESARAGGSRPVEPDRLDPRRRAPMGGRRASVHSGHPGLDSRSLGAGGFGIERLGGSTIGGWLCSRLRAGPGRRWRPGYLLADRVHRGQPRLPARPDP